jgi:hypothetical protein
MTNLKRKITLTLMALCGGAALLVAVVLHVKDPSNAGRADFRGFYLAGTVLNKGPRSQLYNTDFQLSLRQVLFDPGVPSDVFLHPPFEALLFAPLARLPYTTAYILWDVANLLMLAVCLFLLRPFARHFDRDARLLFTLAMLYPLISTLGEGQDSMLLLLLYVLAFLHLKKGGDFTAGCALGASLFRFQFTLPFLIVLLARRRWRALVGASAVGALLAAISVGLIGQTGIRSYVHMLLTRTRGTYVAAVQMPTLRGFIDTLLASRVSELARGILVGLSSLLLLVWLLWKWANKTWEPEARSFDLMFSLSVVVAFMLSFHALIHTMLVLGLPMLLVLDYWAADKRIDSRRWVTVAPLVLLFVTAVLVGAVTVNSFTYLFPAILLFALAISAEISRLEQATGHGGLSP